MAISTNGTVLARVAGALYNTQMSNATYSEVKTLDPAALANTLYARDFGSATDLSVATTLVANLGLTSVAGLTNWVAAQLTAAGSAKGAKVVDLLNSFAQMTADTTYGAYATAFNAKVDAALVLSQTTGNAGGTFAAAGTAVNASFTLSSGIDTLVGGAGDDTFTAPAISASSGVATTTINSGDSIDGGAGNNTLTINATATNNNSLSGLTVANIQTVVVNGSDNIGVNALIAAKNAATAAKAATADTLTAAAAVKVAADATAATATTADTAADGVVSGLASLRTDITALTSTSTQLETDIAALTATAVTNGYLSSTAKTAVDAPTGKTATLAALVTYETAATSAAAATEIAKVAAVAAATAATANQGTAATADAIAAANLTAATTAAASITATNAQIVASKFVGSTSITVDGVATDVTGITNQKVTIAAGVNATATLKYSSTATTASVGLTSTGGTITLQDNSTSTATTGVTSVAVSGSTYGSSASLHTPAGAGSITLVDKLNGGANDDSTDTIKTASFALTNSSAVVTTGLTKLTTIDASASTGNLTLASNGAKVAGITTGSGADSVTIATATSATDVTKPAAVTVSTGAGNDTIYVATSGTGTTVVNGEAGNDTVVLGTVAAGVLTPTALSSLITLNGGDGTDTLSVGSGTLGASDYALIASQTSSFETIKFVPTGNSTGTAASVKASSLSQFTGLQFTSGGTSGANAATKVADNQILTIAGTDLTAQSASYILTTDDDAAAGQTSTNYGTGTLTANVTGAAGTDITLLSNAAVVNVAPTAPTAAGAIAVATSATIGGDVKTLTVNVASSANYVKAPDADIESTVAMVVIKGASNNLAALTSVTVTGNGHVSIDNSNATGSTANALTKLATVDASALTSVVKTGALAGTASGNALTYTANANVAETVILGTGLGIDSITNTTSTYDKTDTITGFKLVADASGGVNAAVSDVLHIGTGFAAVGAGTATALPGTTLGAVLVNAAALTANKVVFQFGGDTYVYQDSTNAGTLDAADFLLKLTGLVDVNLLAASIVS